MRQTLGSTRTAPPLARPARILSLGIACAALLAVLVLVSLVRSRIRPLFSSGSAASADTAGTSSP